MAASLYKLSDLSSRWVSNRVWIQTGIWVPDPPEPSNPDVPDDAIGGDDPQEPYSPCAPGYHLVSTAVVEGPYTSPPYYRTSYVMSCVKD